MPTPNALAWVAGPQTPCTVYLTRLWNFGTWTEWQEARRRYSGDQLQDVVRRPLRGQWTRRGKAFAETVCRCRMPNTVLVSYDA